MSVVGSETGVGERTRPLESPLTVEVTESLAREGAEVVDNWLGELYRYDVEAYERVPRKDTPFGGYAQWDFRETDALPALCARPECTGDRPYIHRLGGFVRGNLFGPDEIGQLLREHNIWHTDAPGNGLLESLMITRKYGLRLHFECPVYNLPDPYTSEEIAAYREVYRSECRRMAEWLRRIERIYGHRFLRQEGQLWVVREKYTPLELFVRCCRRRYEAINAEFRADHGADLPLVPSARSPQEKALRIRFWKWIRRKHAEVLRAQAEVFREEVAGERGVFVSNIHFCPHPDWARWGEIFDLVGVAARPGLLDDELMWRYYVGYVTRLAADLTGKPPLISLRYNLFAAGARIIGTPAAIRYWFGECVRNGVAGFYHWVKDYSSSSDRSGYTGACVGNPDPSTLPRQRWETFLEVCRQLGSTRVFIPPRADAAVFVSLDSCALDGWRRVLSAHIELRRAGVWHNFISDDLVTLGRVRLGDFRVVFVPFAPFVTAEVAEALGVFVRQGGTLVVADPEAFRYDLCGRSTEQRRHGLLGVAGLVSRAGAGETIRFGGSYHDLAVATWGNTNAVIPAPGAEVAARYADGAPAVIARRVGAGRVITFGAEVFDVAVPGRRGQPLDDGDRCRLLRQLAEEAGASDQSWVWRVTLENLSRVTGQYEVVPPPIDDRVQFRSYMYEHSCLHIVPWLTEGQWSGTGQDTEETAWPQERPGR